MFYPVFPGYITPCLQPTTIHIAGGFFDFQTTFWNIYIHGTKPPTKNPVKKILRPSLEGFGFFASVTGVFCYSGLVRGFFATVGVGGFLRQCWGGFLRQWKGFWLRQGGFFASVVVFCDGNRGLLHRRRFRAEGGLVRGFFATVGVGGSSSTSS